MVIQCSSIGRATDYKSVGYWFESNHCIIFFFAYFSYPIIGSINKIQDLGGTNYETEN